MTIKQIRVISGLSQVKFGQKYGIPRRTIESWECDKDNPNYRPCPDYVRKSLKKVVKEGFGYNERTESSMRKAASILY